MSIATSTISPSSVCFARSEQVAFAHDALREAFALAVLDRAARKVTNQALLIIGLPSLAGARSLEAYASTLPANSRRTLDRIAV